MDNKNYQYNFAENSDVAFDIKNREMKGKKIVAVLEDYSKGSIKNKNLLDIGCSTGVLTYILSGYVKSAKGIDIDSGAIDYAINNFKKENLSYSIGDSLNVSYPDKSFDIIVCAHIYEHVPNPNKMMKEIYRLLKDDGICCFIAGNRLELLEPHYHLPLLSVLPKFIGHRYLKLFRKIDYYYETHLTLWGLKQLVKDFNIVDYTKKIIFNPEKFYASDLLVKGSLKYKLANFISNYFYWLCPDFFWILKK